MPRKGPPPSQQQRTTINTDSASRKESGAISRSVRIYVYSHDVGVILEAPDDPKYRYTVCGHKRLERPTAEGDHVRYWKCAGAGRLARESTCPVRAKATYFTGKRCGKPVYEYYLRDAVDCASQAPLSASVHDHEPPLSVKMRNAVRDELAAKLKVRI